MTTKVTVNANHGWPVDVTPINVKTGEAGPIARVLPGAEGVFYVHSDQDLRIHEVQPHELPTEGQASRV